MNPFDTTKAPPQPESPAQKDTIDRMVKWCSDNYNKGADTMVECWDRQDHVNLLNQEGSEKAAMEQLKTLASIYSERQADAEYYRLEGM